MGLEIGRFTLEAIEVKNLSFWISPREFTFLHSTEDCRETMITKILGQRRNSKSSEILTVHLWEEREAILSPITKSFFLKT